MSAAFASAVAQHCLNPLHVYCRLCDLGLPESLARALSCGYERALFRPAAAALRTGRKAAGCKAAD